MYSCIFHLQHIFFHSIIYHFPYHSLLPFALLATTEQVTLQASLSTVLSELESVKRAQVVSQLSAKAEKSSLQHQLQSTQEMLEKVHDEKEKEQVNAAIYNAVYIYILYCG